MQRAELREQIRELVQRWLPMLLSRAGVSQRETLMLREAATDQAELRRQLVNARRAVERVVNRNARERVGNAALAESAMSIVSGLCRALDLQYRDLRGARRRFDSVRRELFELIVVGPSSTEFRPSTWWSRVLSRSVGAEATLLN